MNLIGKLFIVLITCALFHSCDDQSPFVPNPDQGNNNLPRTKVIKLPGRINSTSSEWDFGYDEDPQMVEFNLSEFKDLKAIYFQPTISSNSDLVYCLVQLYNLTDEKPIENTLLWTNRPQATTLKSPDILGKLPPNKVTLAVRIRSEQEGYGVASYNEPFLLLEFN